MVSTSTFSIDPVQSVSLNYEVSLKRGNLGSDEHRLRIAPRHRGRSVQYLRGEGAGTRDKSGLVMIEVNQWDMQSPLLHGVQDDELLSR